MHDLHDRQRSSMGYRRNTRVQKALRNISIMSIINFSWLCCHRGVIEPNNISMFTWEWEQDEVSNEDRQEVRHVWLVNKLSCFFLQVRWCLHSKALIPSHLLTLQQHFYIFTLNSQVVSPPQRFYFLNFEEFIVIKQIYRILTFDVEVLLSSSSQPFKL